MGSDAPAMRSMTTLMGFGGFDGGEEVIEFRSSVVRPGVNLIVLFAQAAGRAIV